jgi:hypothetical protein
MGFSLAKIWDMGFSLANLSGLPKFEAHYAPITFINYFLVKM